MRGDTFQMVLSRRFEQQFSGDEFNVYRALRNINPSLTFLFRLRKLQNLWFQSGKPVDYKRPKAIIHPIAGTFKHTGNVETDLASAEALRKDQKKMLSIPCLWILQEMTLA